MLKPQPPHKRKVKHPYKAPLRLHRCNHPQQAKPVPAPPRALRPVSLHTKPRQPALHQWISQVVLALVARLLGTHK